MHDGNETDPRTDRDLNVNVQQQVYADMHTGKGTRECKIVALSASVGVSSTIPCSSKRFLYICLFIYLVALQQCRQGNIGMRK